MTFVARYTNHPAEDLARNWSSYAGGVNFANDLAFCTFATEEELIAAMNQLNGYDGENECWKIDRNRYRFHPAWGSYCEVDYHGLGAYAIEAENLEDAINEAVAKWGENPEQMVMNNHYEPAGDGHFDARECVAFHATIVDGLYIFELN